jgi:phage-related protein
MHGNLREVIEIVASCAEGAFRLTYTEINEVLYVLHTFKKKAHHGVATPREVLDLIERRLADAKEEARRS